MSDPLHGGRFAWVARGGRIVCTVCGVPGYPSTRSRAECPRWWGWTHLGEHVPCPICGRPFTRPAGLAAHRRKAHGERGRHLGDPEHSPPPTAASSSASNATSSPPDHPGPGDQPGPTDRKEPP